MIKKENFIIENYIDHIPEQDYERVTTYAGVADAISKMTYKNIYMIDFYKWAFPYVSPNPFFLCGMPAEQVKELGYEFYLRCIPQGDLTLLAEITRAAFSFMKRVPSDELLKYTVSCNFHLIQTNSSTERLFNHLCTPVELTKDGKIWLALCTVIPTSEPSGVAQIFKAGSDISLSYDMKSGKWKQNQNLKLKETEKEIILLSALGFKTKEIADELLRSAETIKAYKHRIYQKFEVKNMSEAIIYAMNRRLF